jgi:hypothetical protein
MVPNELWESWAATAKLHWRNLTTGDSAVLKGIPKELLTVICWLDLNALLVRSYKGYESQVTVVDSTEVIPIATKADRDLEEARSELPVPNPTEWVNKPIQVRVASKLVAWAKLRAINPALAPEDIPNWKGYGLIINAAAGSDTWNVMFHADGVSNSIKLGGKDFDIRDDLRIEDIRPVAVNDTGDILNAPAGDTVESRSRSQAKAPELVPRDSNATTEDPAGGAEGDAKPTARSTNIDDGIGSDAVNAVVAKFVEAYKLDPSVRHVYKYLSEGTFHDSVRGKMKEDLVDSAKTSYLIENRLLFKIVKVVRSTASAALVKKLVVPRSLVYDLIGAFHNAKNHAGLQELLPVLEDRFYFDDARKVISLYVECCRTCQRVRKFKYLPNYWARQMGSLKASRVGDIWGMDLVGLGEAESEGDKYVLVVTDHMTRFEVLVPLVNKEAVTVAKALYEEIFCKFGIPAQILSDQGSEFVSRVMDQLVEWLGASRRFISTGNPGGNGVVERFNGEIVRAVKKMRLDNPDRTDWRIRI